MSCRVVSHLSLGLGLGLIFLLLVVPCRVVSCRVLSHLGLGLGPIFCSWSCRAVSCRVSSRSWSWSWSDLFALGRVVSHLGLGLGFGPIFLLLVVLCRVVSHGGRTLKSPMRLKATAANSLQKKL